MRTKLAFTIASLFFFNQQIFGQFLNSTYILNAPHVASLAGNGMINSVGNENNLSAAFQGNPAILSLNKKYRYSNLSYFNLGAKVVNPFGQTLQLASSVGNRHSIGFAQSTYFNSYFYNSNLDLAVLEVQTNYSFQINEHWSAGLAARFIRDGYLASSFSSLFINHTTSLGFDLGAIYKSNLIQKKQHNIDFNWGVAMTNVGGKTELNTFLPSRLQTGIQLLHSWNIGKRKLENTLSYQIGKSLVPQQPIYTVDSNGKYQLLSGYDNNVSSLKGIVQSFYDAPGRIFVNPNGEVEVEKGSIIKEEIKSINHHFGLQSALSFNESWKLRASVSVRSENIWQSSTNIWSGAFSTGVQFKSFRFDFAYSDTFYNSIIYSSAPRLYASIGYFKSI